MFNKLKQVVEATMEALAPLPPIHEDFVYHWKRFMKHYLNLSYEHKAAAKLTNLPGYLDRLRNILISEDEHIYEGEKVTEIGPCMEYLLKHNLLDLLVSLAISDEPPGMKSCVLRFFSKTLTQLKEPNVAHSSFYVPLMKLMNVCNGILHSVSEVDEIEFLLHLCAVLKKQPFTTELFISDESTGTLEERTEISESIQYRNIMDHVLTYVDSADSEIRVKACQCILLLCSTEDGSIATCIVNNVKFNHFIVGRLTALFFEISAVDYEYFKNIEASWTLDIPQESQLEIIKNRAAVVFFCWVDFVNQLNIECHELIKQKLGEFVINNFLNEAFKTNFFSSAETVAIFCKYYRMITSPVLRNGFQKWLMAKEGNADILNVTRNPILQTLIDNCMSEDDFKAIVSLEFFVEVLCKCDDQIIYRLILCYLRDRAYYDATAVASSWSDEEDERQKFSSSTEALSSSRTLAPSNVDRIIKNFESLIPVQVRTESSIEEIHYWKRQYKQMLERCAQFQWPVEATSDVESVSNDSNPESDCHNKQFYEGPFLDMIFTKIMNFTHLSVQQMIVITDIISKLALLPHPYLHEYILNPLVPLRKDVQSLYTSLSTVMNDIYSRVQLILNYQNELRATKERMMSEEYLTNRGEIDRYLEAYVLLEELSSELATIAYVKYDFKP